MTKKAIYRTAIVNNNYEVIFMSDILYLNRDKARAEAKKTPCEEDEDFEKEEIIKPKYIEVCIKTEKKDNWYIFEKIKKDINKTYIGIITETLILE